MDLDQRAIPLTRTRELERDALYGAQIRRHIIALKSVASGRAPQEEAMPEAGTDDEKSAEAEAVEQGEQRARRLHKLLSPWVFRIPQWQHAYFVTRLEPLIKKEPAAATGS